MVVYQWVEWIREFLTREAAAELNTDTTSEGIICIAVRVYMYMHR